MTSDEVRAELKGLSYDRATFNQVIKLVWDAKYDNSFWHLVCRRLIATVIVGIQE